MREYVIFISDEAANDIDNLTNVIMYEYKAPLTAFKYVQGLLDTILSLRHAAESLPFQTNRQFLQYGHYVRRINYERMAIIYTVHNTSVYIHRIIAASAIPEP